MNLFLPTKEWARTHTRHILTERQTVMMRRLYSLDIPLDEVSKEYVGVILCCLDTIDDLRAALKIERGEFQAPPTRTSYDERP